ncbi:MAG: NUDIX domain-containing protein [Ilumatobacteraceae bacterium]
MSADPASGLRIRQAVRALILDPDDRVLLVRFEFPNTGRRWALPGGGIDPGESHHDALHRELDEELGLTNAVIGPLVWQRLHIIPFINGLFDGQRDHIYLVRVTAFEPAPRLSWAELNAEYVFELRWCRLADLADLGPLVPEALPAHLVALLRDGPPKEPVDVGV